jgi:hypothetical protein
MIAQSNGYVIPPPPQPAIAVAGSAQRFPVRRIWCVGREIAEVGTLTVTIGPPAK